MITTYLLENINKGTVINYYRKLSEAKEQAKDGESILCIKGQYFGEGFHIYRLHKVKGKFVKEKIK